MLSGDFAAVRKSPFVKSFGVRVRELRMQRGYSQEELGEIARLHRNAVSLIERGDRSSTLETIEKLAHAFGVQPSKLIPEIEAIGSQARRPRVKK